MPTRKDHRTLQTKETTMDRRIRHGGDLLMNHNSQDDCAPCLANASMQLLIKHRPYRRSRMPVVIAKKDDRPDNECFALEELVQLNVIEPHRSDHNPALLYPLKTPNNNDAAAKLVSVTDDSLHAAWWPPSDGDRCCVDPPQRKRRPWCRPKAACWYRTPADNHPFDMRRMMIAERLETIENTPVRTVAEAVDRHFPFDAETPVYLDSLTSDVMPQRAPPPRSDSPDYRQRDLIQLIQRIEGGGELSYPWNTNFVVDRYQAEKSVSFSGLPEANAAVDVAWQQEEDRNLRILVRRPDREFDPLLTDSVWDAMTSTDETSLFYDRYICLMYIGQVLQTIKLETVPDFPEADYLQFVPYVNLDETFAPAVTSSPCAASKRSARLSVRPEQAMKSDVLLDSVRSSTFSSVVPSFTPSHIIVEPSASLPSAGLLDLHSDHFSLQPLLSGGNYSSSSEHYRSAHIEAPPSMPAAAVQTPIDWHASPFLTRPHLALNDSAVAPAVPQPNAWQNAPSPFLTRPHLALNGAAFEPDASAQPDGLNPSFMPLAAQLWATRSNREALKVIRAYELEQQQQQQQQQEPQLTEVLATPNAYPEIEETSSKGAKKSKKSVNKENTPATNRRTVCGFCRSNKESEEVYRSHPLQKCPVLQKYVCPMCNIKGHTVSHCLKQPRSVFKMMNRHKGPP